MARRSRGLIAASPAARPTPPVADHDRPRRRSVALAHVIAALGGLCAVAGCRTTVDSLGYNDAGGNGGGDGGGGIVLHPLSGPTSYPNAFRDVLGKGDAEIADKIAAAFAQLFHGDPATQAIYVPVGSDQAYIQDFLHGDVRTEGMSYAMIIAVQLDKRDEFDRLWRYAKAQLMYATGPNRGYFRSSCDLEAGPSPCVDPFGHQQFVMALLLARDRWAQGAVTIDYGTDAIALFDVMRKKDSEAEAAAAGVTNTFDVTTRLAFDVPNVSAASQTRPSILMPAFYQLWAQATADAFWIDVAARARAFWKVVANPTTGFMPVRAGFDGKPLAGWDSFQPEGYRTQLNIVLDRIWFGTDPWDVDEANRLLQFFASRGIATYGKAFSLDGATTLDPAHDPSLVAVNGLTASIATTNQAAFVGEVWNMPIPVGPVRYYQGILELLSLLVLSGQYRVY